MKLKKINKIIIFSAALFITVLISLFCIATYIYLPEYSSLFNELGNELPVLTNVIFDTYKYWIIMPIICLFFTVKIIYLENELIRKQYILFSVPVVFFIITIMLFVTSLYGVYLPIIELGQK
jgi:type II secretory pathway component PulF